MTGYVRKDTTNNIADGNVINAADLDAEFDGVQDAFNASTGHNHDGTTGEGAPITALGPTQDVTISASLLAPKTTNTVDIGSSSLKFKDLFLAGNGSIGGTLAVTGVATFTAQPILSSLTASRAVFSDGSKGLVSNAITGTGNVVMSASPTLTGTIDAAALTASGNLTLSAGTANGVAYLNGSKVVTSGSALTFDGSNLAVTGGLITATKGSANGITIGDVSTNSNSVLRLQGTSSGYNFQLANNLNVGGFELTPSTATGGVTYTTPVYSVTGLGVHAWSAGGSEGMRLTSTGLGIGTSSWSTSKLYVLGNTTNYGITSEAPDGYGSLNIKQTSGNTMSIGMASNGLFIYDSNAGTTRLTLDSSGNLGLGVTPSAWGTLRGIDIVAGASFAGAYNTAYVAGNAYFNGTNWIYKAPTNASLQETGAGFAWKVAPSGTAGNAITFTQAMTLDASGNLGVGTTSPDDITSGYTTVDVRGSTGGGLRLGVASGNNMAIYASATTSVIEASGSSDLQFVINAAERARIDSGGRLLVGTTTSTGTIATFVGSQQSFIVRNGVNSSYNELGVWDGASDGLKAVIKAEAGVGLFGTRTNSPMAFQTNDTERARIDTSGNLLVGKTATSTSTAGAVMEASGTITATRAELLFIANRLTTDGTLILFRQDNTDEGSISVSGTTVSYNGGHLSRWAQTTTAKDDSLVKGTVLSNLDEMNVYTDSEGNPVDNEQLNKVKVSDVEGDANVAGVFVNWTHDEQHNVDEINMAMTGDMIIRIAQGTTVARGDLLMSAGDGTAKPQGDDIVRSKTVAKVTSNHVTCTYADGSYCVPCVLMAC